MPFSIPDFFDRIATATGDAFEALDEALDFGFDEDTIAEVTGRVPQTAERNVTPDRDVDLTELERANPTNTNFAPLAGIPQPVIYIGLGILTLIALRATKVI